MRLTALMRKGLRFEVDIHSWLDNNAFKISCLRFAFFTITNRPLLKATTVKYAPVETVGRFLALPCDYFFVAFRTISKVINGIGKDEDTSQRLSLPERKVND